jgi:hypothetical protein
MVAQWNTLDRTITKMLPVRNALAHFPIATSYNVTLTKTLEGTKTEIDKPKVDPTRPSYHWVKHGAATDIIVTFEDLEPYRKQAIAVTGELRVFSEALAQALP